MIDFESFSHSLKQFLETIIQNPTENTQKLQTPTAPDKAVALEFEKYLNADIDPTQIPTTENTSFSVPNITNQENTETNNLIVDPKEYFHEVEQIITKITNNTLSQTDLFRLQYLTSVLNVKITQHSTLINKTTNQFEQILKQQG